MDKGILLATKTLVECIRHYIRDPSGVFSVCHAREWYIDKSPPFRCCFFSKWGEGTVREMIVGAVGEGTI